MSYMSIQAINNCYNQIVASDLIQTTIQSIQSLANKIFINPSSVCLAGHTLAINCLISFADSIPLAGSVLHYLLISEGVFILIQYARKIYNHIQNS